MDTTTIKPGDVIKVDDGLVWFGMVTGPMKGGVFATFLPPKSTYARRVKSRDIVGHWRKSAATTKRENARLEA